MNNNTVLLQINSAINLLKGLKSGIAELPQRQQRKIPGSSYIADVIRRLEIAKAEINGEPWPTAPVTEIDPALAELIDN